MQTDSHKHAMKIHPKPPIMFTSYKQVTLQGVRWCKSGGGCFGHSPEYSYSFVV